MHPKAGLSPGSLIHHGERYVDMPTLAAYSYDAKTLEHTEVTAEALPAPSDRPLWLNVLGVHDPALMQKLGETYKIPSLVLEDIMNTEQRPKFETMAEGSFLVIRMLRWQDGMLDDEQITLWWSGNTLVSLQEKPGDCFDPLRERLKKPGGRLRTMGSSYLAYALADAVADHMFLVLDALTEALADLEERVLEDWQHMSLSDLQAIRRALLHMRRTVSPLRDAAASMLQADSAMPTAMRPYLRDLHDHTQQALERVEQQRDFVATVRDLWMNAQATHMNRVMQTLTVVATIFIPLTFLAGIYGMNFDHMPELHHRYAYPTFISVSVVTAIAMGLWFRAKGWLGKQNA